MAPHDRRCNGIRNSRHRRARARRGVARIVPRSTASKLTETNCVVMRDESTAAYRFGDLLALARRSWVQRLKSELEQAGYADYRRSDSLAIRQLASGPLSVGRFGVALGVSRQDARKVAATLEARGYARALRNADDARQLDIVLTERGRECADAIDSTTRHVNNNLAMRLSPNLLVAPDTVLRASLSDEHSRALAAHIPTPA